MNNHPTAARYRVVSMTAMRGGRLALDLVPIDVPAATLADAKHLAGELAVIHAADRDTFAVFRAEADPEADRPLWTATTATPLYA